MRPKKKEIELYNSIDSLLFYNWDRYLATKDNNWFIIGYDGRDKKIQSDVLTQLEATIQDEYFKEINDNDFTKKLQKWAKIDNLTTKYNYVSSVLQTMWLGFGNNEMELRLKYVEMLAKWGFIMSKVNTVDGDFVELTRINQELQGVKTQIKILQDELKEDGVIENKSLGLQLKIMTKALGFTVGLNAKELTVKEWVELGKELVTLSKKN
jgi:hypothetical protein